MRRPPPAPTFKVVLLGEGRVGKTSLLVRYVHDAFSDQQPATVQAGFLSKRVIVGSQPVNLAIWDTAGQERFHALGPIYYRDADAALLVYDITDRDSFERVKSWVKELRKMANKDILLTVAANKFDTDVRQHAEPSDAKSYAESIGAKYFQTSAKLNTGIADAFLSISERLLERSKDRPMEVEAVPQRKGVLIVDERPRAEPRARQSCCV